MLSVTAATPILRGYLADIDVRWPIIEASVDDRTDEEARIIDKSRYSPVSSYLSAGDGFKPEYNDYKLIYDEKYYQQLLQNDVPDLLAKHIAHLFIRDPLVVYGDRIEVNDEKDVDHFENIQSSNWQSCRFKPPPLGGPIGWRVEFRTMELMFTDFENAAVVCFICVLVRMIQSGLFSHVYMPITQVIENMRTAEKRASVTDHKFWFKKNMMDPNDSDVVQLTVNQILNGSNDFQGIIPLMREFLIAQKTEPEVMQLMDSYLGLLSKRADGTLITNAKWIRNYVAGHPSYNNDSIVTDEIAYDLMKTITLIEQQKLKVPEMYGDFY